MELPSAGRAGSAPDRESRYSLTRAFTVWVFSALILRSPNLFHPQSSPRCPATLPRAAENCPVPWQGLCFGAVVPCVDLLVRGLRSYCRPRRKSPTRTWSPSRGRETAAVHRGSASPHGWLRGCFAWGGRSDAVVVLGRAKGFVGIRRRKKPVARVAESQGFPRALALLSPACLGPGAAACRGCPEPGAPGDQTLGSEGDK